MKMCAGLMQVQMQALAEALPTILPLEQQQRLRKRCNRDGRECILQVCFTQKSVILKKVQTPVALKCLLRARKSTNGRSLLLSLDTDVTANKRLRKLLYPLPGTS